jgi:HTH-type transcriptional regulator / antitoxin HigA
MNETAEVFPPGELLKDELEARNWSQTEFAEIIGRPVRLVNEIIAGKRAITPETAAQFGASLGTSAQLWMNLESQYQLSQLQPVDNSIERKARLHAKFPVRECIRRGWIAANDDVEELEIDVLSFFGVNHIDEHPSLAHAAKKSSYEDVLMPQWAWLFRAKQIAETVVVKKYKKDALTQALSKLKSLLVAPEEARHVPKLLNDAGVRFVLIEALPSSKIDGACLWLSDTQPVIVMSARLDRIDNFWFVLRHEIEHLLHEHGKDKLLMLDEDLSETAGADVASEERVANQAASQFAVSDEELRNYMARVNPYFFAEDRVRGFSARLGVHPGIVVGRLQRTLEKANYPNPYKFLRSYLVKVRHIVSHAAPTDGWGQVFPIK